MTTPPEVLAAMAESAGRAHGLLCDAATCNGMCEAPEAHFAPAVQAALAAAEALGWELRPADESADLREAVEELGRAWGFHDRVVASPDDERAAVGSDHHEWCERAARSAIRALATAPRVTP